MDKQERIIEYKNEDLTIFWKPKTCIHAAECVKRLPKVYKPRERPWLTIENATTKELKEQIDACPSGALSYMVKEESLKIKQEDNLKKGEFYIEVEGKREAKMTYTYAGIDKIIIDHTEVNDSLRGKKIGYKLVQAAVQFMRDKNLKVIPLCPFAKSVFDKTPEFADRLA